EVSGRHAETDLRGVDSRGEADVPGRHVDDEVIRAEAIHAHQQLTRGKLGQQAAFGRGQQVEVEDALLGRGDHVVRRDAPVDDDLVGDEPDRTEEAAARVGCDVAVDVDRRAGRGDAVDDGVVGARDMEGEVARRTDVEGAPVDQLPAAAGQVDVHE